MTRRMQENVVAGIVLCLFLAAIVTSLGYSPRARMVPLPIATLGAILTVLQIAWQNLRSADELQVDILEMITGRAADEAMPAAGPKTNEGPARASGGPGTLRKELTAIGVVALLLAGFVTLGPLPASALFVAAYFAMSRQYKLFLSIAYACLFVLTAYLLFGYVLGVQLDRGVLMEWLR